MRLASLARQNESRPSQRAAIVIVAVLVVVMILGFLGEQYLEVMLAEWRTSDNVERAAQTRLSAVSGINFVAALLANKELMLGGPPYDAPDVFHGQIMAPSDIPRHQCRFSIVAPVQVPGQSATDLVRFGVVDEGSKINLNAIMKLDKKGDTLYEMLLKLPAMEPTVAAAIVDWLDEDGEPRDGGAEEDSYSTLDPPYHCKNGPLESIEELLLVQGVTPYLLFGNDLNRNGMIDGNESADDPVMALGWSAYITIYSREQNITKDNHLRVNLNEQDLQSLQQKLLAGGVSEELTNYALLYRMKGGQQIASSANGDSGNKSGGGNSKNNKNGNSNANAAGDSLTGLELDLTNQKGKNKIKSMCDLINSQVSVSGGRGQPSALYQSPLNDPEAQEQLIPLLFDQTTVTKDSEIPARININTAPMQVIAALPGLEPEDVEKILAARPNPDSFEAASAVYQTPAWLLTKAGLEPEKVKSLEKYVTTYSQVYRVNAIGYFDQGGTFTRLEAIVDTNAGRPRILLFRDMTSLGKGFVFQPPQ